MPQPSTGARKATTKTKSKAKKQSLLGKLRGNRYTLPALFALAFMGIGAGGMYLVSAATTTYNLWGTTIPKTLAVSDGSSVELGVKFKATVSGYVTGVRFYKSAQNTGVHTGDLWDSKGKLLATVKFTNETSSGWQTAMFAQPVNIASNVTYVISYYAPNGHYSVNPHYLTTTRTKKYLVAPASTATDPNGVYVAASAPNAFPSQSGNGANYWVDVLFNAKLVSPQPAPAAPASLSASVQPDGSVILNWSASTGTNIITQYSVYRNGGKLADVSTALTYTDTTTQAGNTYSYQVQATDNTGQKSALSVSTSATIPSAPVTTPPPPPSATCSSTTPNHVAGGPDGTGTCWPGPDNTGVPAGTVLTAYTGPLTITTDNTVIDGKNITCPDGLGIQAANVVIKNSKVNCYISLNADLPGGTNWSLTVQDSEVNANNSLQSAISDANLTLIRVNVHGGINGAECDPPMNQCTIRDSYIHGQTFVQSYDTHLGGFLSDGGQSLTIVHNTIVCDTLVNNVGGGCTGDVNFIPNFAAINGALIQHNLLGANTNASYCTYGGEKSTSATPHSYNIVYKDNIFQRGSNNLCANYGPVTNFNVNGLGNQWLNNTWDTGGAVDPAL